MYLFNTVALYVEKVNGKRRKRMVCIYLRRLPKQPLCLNCNVLSFLTRVHTVHTLYTRVDACHLFTNLVY